MSLESTKLEDWQAIVSNRAHISSPEFPESIAHAMFEASRLQYLAAHRSEMDHMGFRLDGGPSEEPIEYELVSESDGQAYNARAQELANQVKDYIESTCPLAEDQSDYDARVGHYCFDSISNLGPGNLALINPSFPREVPENAIAFHVPGSVSRRLYQEFKSGMSTAQEQLSDIANEMIPGRAEAEKCMRDYMDAARAGR